MVPQFLHSLDKRIMVIVIAACLFVVLTMLPSLGLPADTPYTSPDETANAFFINRIAQGKHLTIPTIVTPGREIRVAMRSTTIVGSNLVPTSFLGALLLYGWADRLFGPWIIFFLTSILAAIAGLCFYRLLLLFFSLSKATARLGTLLFFINPGVWYYTSRPYFHNALFLFMGVIAFYCIIATLRSSNRLLAVLTGILIGAMMVIRSSEVFWVGPAVLAMLWYGQKHLRWSVVLFGISGVVLAIIPVLIANVAIYGAAFSTGYTQYDIGQASTEMLDSHGREWLRYVFPFGIHLSLALSVAGQYLLRFFPWVSIPAIIGLFVEVRLLFQRSLSRAHRWYLILFLFTATWLILYYGSWTLHEFEDSGQSILASSYTRYWLPLWVLVLPYAALGIQYCITRWPFSRGRTLLLPLSLGVATVLSFSTVWFDDLHGLTMVRQTRIEEQKQLHLVEGKVESNALLISGIADKIFFPRYHTVVELPDNVQQTINGINTLLLSQSVYIYANVGDRIADRNLTKINQANFRVKEVYSDDRGALYQVYH